MKRFALLCIVMLKPFIVYASAANLTGVKGTIKSIDKAVNASVAKAEELFQQNNGAHNASTLNLLSSGNLFLQKLDITSDYKVKLQFSISDANTEYGTIPVAKALAGKIIFLIPIIEEGSTVISSWECITNADESVETFMGSDTSASTGNTSFISLDGNSGDNQYLSNCIFMQESEMNNISE